MRPKSLEIRMLLTFEMLGDARNHGKKFPQYSQTALNGIVNCDVIFITQKLIEQKIYDVITKRLVIKLQNYGRNILKRGYQIS